MRPDDPSPALLGSDPPSATLDTVLAELRAIRRVLEAQAAELLDARGAAALLGLSRSSFFRLVASGKLPKPIRFGEQLRRWRRAALLDTIDA
jgi:predicted DNA-binding transcriptional regulator AlpA